MVKTIKQFAAKKNEQRTRCKTVKSYLNKVLYEKALRKLMKDADENWWKKLK